MAIYHFAVGVVSRGKGQSVVAKAAYNARAELTNENTGEAHDYTRAKGLLFSGIFAPKDAPEWVHDREKLWCEVEKCEKRKDAQLARNVELSLPHELTDEQRERLLKDFVRENFVRLGMVADVSIHAPDREGDGRNHHAHILLTMRELGPEGFGAKVREWNSKGQLETWRENWERTANRYLERHGHDERIDHRTLAAQGIDREPTKHLGPTASQMEREGAASDRGDINREILDGNAEREMLRELNGGVDRAIEDTERREEKAKPDEKTGTTLYDRGDMVSQQQDANRHAKDQQKAAEAHRAEQEKATKDEKEKQDRQRTAQEQDKAKAAEQEKGKREEQEKKAKQAQPAPTKERTDRKQNYSQREIMRELFEKQFGVKIKTSRDDHDRDRERER